MKRKIIGLIICMASIGQVIGQANIMLLPFVGKDKTEVVMAYRTADGKSMEWYYDEPLKKMMKAKDGFQLPAETGVTGQTMMKAYIGADGSEVVLVWSPVTGQSVSWYYDNGQKKMMKSPDNFQLPANVGLTGNIRMFPYIGADKSEVVLCWETNTGKSVSYYYNTVDKVFRKADENYQLPVNPGISGNIMMHPYIGKDGSEVVLAWDVNTGKSISWYYDNNIKKFLRAPDAFQLPDNPGVNGSVMMHPYIGSDKSEVVLVWSTINGASMMWYYDNLEQRFMKAKSEFQLPTNTGISQNVMMMPFVEKNHDEVVYIWNTVTGASVNFYFNDNERKYIKSLPQFQLPAELFQ